MLVGREIGRINTHKTRNIGYVMCSAHDGQLARQQTCGAWHVDCVMKTRWQRTRDVEAWFLHHRFDTAVGRQSMLPVHIATQGCTTQTSQVLSSLTRLHHRHLKTPPQCDRCAGFARPFPASRPARGLCVGPAQNNDRAHFQHLAKPTGSALTRP